VRSSPWVWAVVFVLILITFQFLTSPRPHTIDYSNFLERVEALPGFDARAQLYALRGQKVFFA